MSALDRNRGSAPVRSFHLDKQNGKLMGVCSGVGNYMGIDANIVRIVFVAGTILGFGSLALIYLAIGLIAD